MQQYKNEDNNFNYILKVIDCFSKHVLLSFVDNYKNSYHRFIKMKPTEVCKKRKENMMYNNLFPDFEFQKPSINKLDVCDLVRINKNKGVFVKGYLPNYTTELFQIAVVKNTATRTYELSDKTGELIIVSFLEKTLEIYSIKTFIL